MKIHQKVILIVTASILATALPGIGIIYNYAQRNIIASESLELERSTARVAASVEQQFSESKPKLSSLAYIIGKELVKPLQPSEIDDFNEIMERNLDGVWRNRKSSYDGKNEAGIFLPKNANESDKQKVQHLRIKKVMDTFGAAANTRNIWYLSLDRSEIIFDRKLPNFVFDQQYDNDYTQTPWVTYTSPKFNPKREVKYTPPLLDPVSNAWMVSVLYPLDVGGQWIGTIGEDMPLTGVLETMFSNSQKFSGTHHLLLDNQGNFVLAGPWQKQLESSSETYRPNLTQYPKLASLLNSDLSNNPSLLGDDIDLQDKRYMVIGALLNPLGWKYFRLIPVDEVLAPSQLLLYTLSIMLLLVMIITGVMIGVAMGSSVANRIKQLSEAMKSYALDHRHRIPVKLGYDDEITEAALVFNRMANEIESGVSERKKANNELKAAEELWRLALEGSGDGVWDWDIVESKVKYSKRWKEIIGFAEDELSDSFEEFEKRLHPEDRERVLVEVQEYILENTPTYKIEFRLQCKDGGYKWISANGIVASRDENNAAQRMVGTHSDISGWKKIENNLSIAATVFESQEGMLVTDADNMILRVNHAFANITGYNAEDIIGKNPRILTADRQDATFYSSMWKAIAEKGSWAGEIWNQRKNGEIYPGYLTITAVKDINGIISNYVSTLTDITKRKQADEEIQHLAFYDSLTGLPNRRLLIDRLNQSLTSSMRTGKGGAIFFLDLDHFKTLNDSLGHDVGDRLLKQVAERIIQVVRVGDTVARLGGDEFIILLKSLSESALEAAAQAEVIGEKIIAVLNQPYQLNKNEYHCTPSIGITLFNGNEKTQEDLLKHADIAMYQAKNAGRNRLRFFDPTMQQAIDHRVDIERELRKALDQQQFQLHYQVQVDISKRPLGAEALIRWLHPERGLISPYHFIPLAEETGLILPIGLWVLETACAQLKQWEQDPLTKDLSISINVSAKQFYQFDFVEQVQAAVLRNGIDPMKLKLELTESMLLENVEETVSKMNALKESGLSFSLDDFGTGYSSLQYLKRLPLTQLKIDQSFVRDIAADISDQEIVRTIIAMAQSLHLDVIAEGVETSEQQELLLNNGCLLYQGYLFGKPVPITEFESLLRKNTSQVN
jgi:diguanylate cyclase (GGDEF)-like protein/PAS domain S-box-containing protein